MRRGGAWPVWRVCRFGRRKPYRFDYRHVAVPRWLYRLSSEDK
jgi:hypothetical protein